MALPKFSELSGAAQVGVILLVGAAVWGASEYTVLSGPKQARQERQVTADRLEKENQPLREFVPKHRQLIAENQQLEMQLQNLQRIVPSEKEVDNFVRQVQGEASLVGVAVRRFTSKTAVSQEFYIELPFEVELDGAYYDVLQFYDRLRRLERIINVSELKMDGIEAGRGGRGKYDYSPAETVVAVCTVTTFFSREEQPPEAGSAPAARPGQRGRAAAPARTTRR
ncbi:MAG: type 4a pilus biogenesis protein PilO [Acidobacteria bacterium]|nr:type 4a pilus biogenesis protein PilO [Acidobacteriota bacterium]